LSPINTELLWRLGHVAAARAVARVLAGFRELDPHPDVAPALAVLREADVSAVTLTNGGVEQVRVLLERAGLFGYVKRSLSVDKPAPLQAGPRTVSVRRREAWRRAGPDRSGRRASVGLRGAHTAGLRAGWVNRRGEPWPEVFTPPDVTGRDLPSVVTDLLASR
jgi:2-haloacid dehalogenase